MDIEKLKGRGRLVPTLATGVNIRSIMKSIFLSWIASREGT